MAEPTSLSNAERRRKERKVWRTGLLLSALVHLLVFVLWPVQSILLSPFSAAGEPARDPRAASGSMQAMNLQAPAAVPVAPVPIPIVADIEIELPDLDEPPAIEVIDPGPGQGLGSLGVPGLSGAGQGDGGTGDDGLFRLIPPSPRGMIIPPSNQRLQGREVEVWVFVDEAGRVVADSTRLEPPTPDAAFNRLLIREAAEWVFRPATQGGEAVASWFPYRISM